MGARYRLHSEVAVTFSPWYLLPYYYLDRFLMKHIFASSVGWILLANASAFAQQQSATVAPPQAPAILDSGMPKPRVFVTDSDSWQIIGSNGGVSGVFAGSSSGGARPQTAEVIKTLGQRCPQVVVNNRADASDYVVRLEHEGGKSILAHKDKVVVFVRKSGDSIFSKSTLSVGGAVQDSCGAIISDWAAHGKEIAAMSAPVATGSAPVAAVLVATQMASLTIDSSVPNSDIEIDGSFVGSTPSTVSVTPGQHTIVVKKKGYSDWTRPMNVSGSGVRVSAELEKAAGGN